jgi:hypothetical protein
MTNAEELESLLSWVDYLKTLINMGPYTEETIYIPTKESSLEETLEKENVIIKKAPRNGGKSTWIQQMSMVQAFDTGGYTGQWGPEGRLAMLHQKEIILNPSDTVNLLASVSLIRDITKQIDL